MLKASYKNADDIPEGLTSFYTEKNGKFVLAVEGLVEKTKLDEFRTNNNSLTSQLEELSGQKLTTETLLTQLKEEITDKYGNIDLDAYRAFEANQQQLEDRKLIDAGKHEEIINRREDELRTEFAQAAKLSSDQWQEQEANATSEISKLNSQLSTLLVDNQLSSIATQYGVVPTALQDILSRGHSVWSVEDGQAIAKDDKGNRMFLDDKTTPVSMDIWIESLAAQAPHLFASSTGTGESVTLTQEEIDQQAIDTQQAPNSAVAKIMAGLEALQ